MLGPPKTLGMTRRAYVTFGAPGRRELFRAVCNVRDANRYEDFGCASIAMPSFDLTWCAQTSDERAHAALSSRLGLNIHMLRRPRMRSSVWIRSEDAIVVVVVLSILRYSEHMQDKPCRTL